MVIVWSLPGRRSCCSCGERILIFNRYSQIFQRKQILFFFFSPQRRKIDFYRTKRKTITFFFYELPQSDGDQNQNRTEIVFRLNVFKYSFFIILYKSQSLWFFFLGNVESEPFFFFLRNKHINPIEHFGGIVLNIKKKA